MNKQDWTYKTFGEVCDIICGQDYKKVESPDGKYPIYGTGGIMGFANQFRCPAHSVIIGRKGSINNPLYVEEDFWIVDTAFGIVPSKAYLLSKYFFYFCKSYDFTKHNVAVTIPSLRRMDLLKIPIPVPPIAEQERIVAELDLLSGIIEKKKEQLKAYDQLAQSIFYTMFGDPIDNPKGWEVKKIGDVCEPKSQIKRASKCFAPNEQIRYIDISSINNSNNTITSMTPFLFSEAPSRAQQKVERGDILVSLVRPNLKNVAIVKDTEKNCVASSGFCVLRSKANVFSSFIFTIVTSDFFTEHLIQRVSGANYPAVKEDDIKDFILPIPPLSLQQEFAVKVEAIERQKALVQQSIEETQTMFDFTMDKYFG